MIRGNGPRAAGATRRPPLSVSTAMRASAVVASLLFRAAAAASPSPGAVVAREEEGAAVARALATANWDIDFADLDADLSRDSTDEVVLQYVVGRDRQHVSRLLAGDCEGNVTGVAINATEPVQVPFGYGDDHDLLTLGYSLDKSALGGSSLWNSTKNAIEFCHELALILPANETGGIGMLVISTDVHRLRIDVDLSVGFAITSGLSPGDVIQMRILGRLAVVGLNVTDEEGEERAAGAVRQAVYRHAEDGLGTGQDVVNAAATFVLRSDGEGGRRLQEGGGSALERQGSALEILRAEALERLQEGSALELLRAEALKRRRGETDLASPLGESAVQDQEGCDDDDDVAVLLYELTLQEGCAIACPAFLNVTTMAETMQSHLEEVFRNGDFAATLADVYQANDADETDGNTNGECVAVVNEFVETPDGLDQAWVPEDLAYADATLEGYVEACRCDGAENFACAGEEAPLSPDSELRVCVWSTSSDVVLDSLDSTVLMQGAITLDVIEEGGIIAVPTITTREYVLGRNGLVVSTRVPSNIFTFAEGESITISGVFKLDLSRSAASTGRRLQESVDGGLKVQAGAGVARFRLDATLTETQASIILVRSSASRVAFASQALATIGAVFLLW